MIDKESEIYTSVRNAVKALYPDLAMSSTYKQEPERFPFAYLEETESAAYRRTQDSGSLERHALVNYSCEVFSNKLNGKKSEAKEIASAIDAEMQRLGFTRTIREPFPNESDASIYRIVMRWRGVIGADNHVYTA